MAIRSKDYLKEKFETGKIPTGQDFADFIETFVASINGEIPNVATGDVPYIGQYNMVEFLPPTVRWDDSRYPEGLSTFIAEFTEDDADWLAIFGDVVPPYGRLVVSTNKNTSENYCLQEVDAIGNGVFNPQYSRSINEDGTWKPLSKIAPIKTINGSSPDIYGNITVSTGNTVEVVDNLTTNSSTKALSAKQGVELYDEVLGIISQISYHFYRMAEVGLPAHVSPDGTTIGVDEDGVISVIADVTGPQGPVGPQGPQGPPGTNGTNGIDGVNGSTGAQGPQGIQGEQGPAGPQGPTGPAGPQGIKGDVGEGFAIAKVYASVSAMNADFSGTDVEVNQFVIINSSDSDNGKLYIKTSTEYSFQSQLTGVKGDKGDEGAQGPAGIQGVTGPAGPQGIQGPVGDTGPAGAKGDKGDKGDSGANFYNEAGLVNNVKVAIRRTTTVANGAWSVDYTNAGFTSVLSIIATLQGSGFSDANKPTSTFVETVGNTVASGIAYKASSAGLLTAMQQIKADAGTTVNVVIIGI